MSSANFVAEIHSKLWHGRALSTVLVYKLTATIRNKVFNSKQTVESIELDEGQSLNDNIYPCSCENPEFCDPWPHHHRGSASH